jgi:hypothetical protein
MQFDVLVCVLRLLSKGDCSMKIGRRALFGLAFLCMLLGVVACEPPVRGDIHLTIEVYEDRSSSVQVEFWMSLVSDALLKLAAEISRPVGTPEPAATPQAGIPQLIRTRRGSRDYAAIRIDFEDVDDLQSWLETASVVREIVPWVQVPLEMLEPVIGDTDVIISRLSDSPTLFSRFEVTVDDRSALVTTYQLDAEVSAATSNLVTPLADMSYHVILPGSGTSSNAHFEEDGVLTWRLQAGQPLQMQAESRVSKLPDMGTSLWVLGGLGILLLAGIVGAVVYWVASRPRRRTPSGPMVYEEPEFDFGDGYSEADFDSAYDDTWSEYGGSDSHDDYGNTDWDALEE